MKELMAEHARSGLQGSSQEWLWYACERISCVV
jgi:hypothetical protein